MLNTGTNNIRKEKRPHRKIMSKIVGRPLLSTEDVHHIDGNHFNNDPKNLQVMTHGEHSRLHTVGRIGAFLGKHFSKEHRAKISAAKKGVPRLDMVIRQTGNHLSIETRKKISIARTGTHLSKETRIKMSNITKGRVKSNETKIRMSTAQKLRWQTIGRRKYDTDTI